MSYDRLVTYGAVAVWLLFAGFVLTLRPAAGHDHNRPALDSWFTSLHSRGKAWCCDGTDAVHLKEVDWTTQDQPKSHYRVKVPVDAGAYERARHGEEVETMWVDVPDDAVIDDPNLEGSAMVWPYYVGGMGMTPRPAIRCFMPGTMS